MTTSDIGFTIHFGLDFLNGILLFRSLTVHTLLHPHTVICLKLSSTSSSQFSVVFSFSFVSGLILYFNFLRFSHDSKEFILQLFTDRAISASYVAWADRNSLLLSLIISDKLINFVQDFAFEYSKLFICIKSRN